jgi:CNP1-like family
MPPARRLLPLLLLIAILSVQARERPFIDEPSPDNANVQDPAPWRELGVSIPAYPQDSDLVELSVDSPGTPFRYFIDAKSLSVGVADQVVRYILVVEANSGSRNVFYEGLRCDGRQIKTYAYGDGKGRLQPVHHSEWRRMRLTGPYRYHLELSRFFFCRQDVSHRPYDVQEILHRLHNPQHAGPLGPGSLF